MKQGRTIPELANELCRQSNAKRDIVMPANRLSVRSNGHTDLVVDEEYPLTTIAHGQLSDYVGIPKAFYDRLRVSTADLRVPMASTDDEPTPTAPLFDVTVNTLLQQKGGEPRLVRMLDGSARALLSDSYNPDLDNYDVFKVAARMIEEAGLTPDNVVSCEVTERRLYIKVVSDKLEATIKPGNVLPGHGYLREPQVVRAGFILTNSEVGLGSLSIQQTIFKLMCTNLWIKEEGYRQRHIGKSLETSDDSGAIYRSDTRLAEAQTRLLKLRDHVADTLDETRFLATVATMQESTEAKIEGSVEGAVNATARKFGLNQTEKEIMLKNLIGGADLSLWGISDAITSTAHSVESYDRATELQAIGFRLLELPRGEQRELTHAA
jgi:hypothetical protein